MTLDVGEREVDIHSAEKRDQEAVGRIAGRVELVRVTLVDATFRAPGDSGESTITPDAIGIEAAADLGEPGHLKCLLGFRSVFNETDPGTPEEPMVVEARFQLEYRLDGDDPADQGDVAQFLRWNAVFNAWPYWREYVQSMSARSGMTRITVGVMGLPA